MRSSGGFFDRVGGELSGAHQIEGCLYGDGGDFEGCAEDRFRSTFSDARGDGILMAAPSLWIVKGWVCISLHIGLD